MRRPLHQLLALLCLVCLAPFARAGKEVLYVHDGPNQVIHAFELKPSDGEPTEIAGSPFSVPGGAVTCDSGSHTIVCDKRGDWLFASTGSGLALFRRDKKGKLVLLGSGPIGPTGELAGLALYEKGRSIWVYAADRSQGLMRIFEIDSKTGATELISTGLTIGTIGGQNGIAASKKFVYATNTIDGTIHTFALDKKTGRLALTVGSPFVISGIGSPSNLLLNKSGNKLVTNDCSQGRYGFVDIDTRTGGPRNLTGFANSSSACTHVFASDKSFKDIYGGGQNGIDISFGASQGIEFLPTSGTVDDGAFNKQQSFLYILSTNDIFLYPMDKKTKRPIVTGTIFVLANAIPARSTGVLIRK
ncbi:MAG: beta-propeller fold lactonase family protein [Planctomycetes bacterium]|nr:beta-propeller fold lactonase family protein [Planctomycetota bacterium]